MGDAEHFVEQRLVATLANSLQTKVLKAGHHGSASSSSIPFLEAVKPKYFVISSGNQDFSGTMLPSAQTLASIQDVSTRLGLGTEVWRTDNGDNAPLVAVGEEGGNDTVVSVTDGNTINVKYVAIGDVTLGSGTNPVVA